MLHRTQSKEIYRNANYLVTMSAIQLKLKSYKEPKEDIP